MDCLISIFHPVTQRFIVAVKGCELSSCVSSKLVNILGSRCSAADQVVCPTGTHSYLEIKPLILILILAVSLKPSRSSNLPSLRYATLPPFVGRLPLRSLGALSLLFAGRAFSTTKCDVRKEGRERTFISFLPYS